MMLGAAKGDVIEVLVAGENAETVLAELAAVVEPVSGKIDAGIDAGPCCGQQARMRRQITGFSNPTVKYLRSLRDKKHRKRSGQFLVEGLRLLEDARSIGRLPQMLVMAEGRDDHASLARLEADVMAAGGEVITTTPDILSKITGKDNAQSVTGVFDEWDTRLAALTRSAAPIWLVAQALRDPGNLGTMLRTGDAVGAGGLILIDECADPFSAEAVRASMGAVFTVPVVQYRGGRRCSPRLRRVKASWWRQACATPCPIARRITARRASFWSATNRKACRRITKRPAICA